MVAMLVAAGWLAAAAPAAAHSGPSASAPPAPRDRRDPCNSNYFGGSMTAEQHRRLAADDPRLLHQRALACMMEGQMQWAYLYLRRAYELRPTWQNAVELANTEAYFDLAPEAYLHFEDAVSKIPATHRLHAEVVRRRDKAREAVTAVTVSVEPEDACVEVNGRPISCGLPVAREHVRRGASTTIRVHHARYATQTIVLDEEDTATRSLEVRVDLTAEAGERSARSVLTLPSLLTGALGLALLGGGVAAATAPGELTEEREAAMLSLVSLGAITSATAGGLFLWRVYAPTPAPDSVKQPSNLDIAAGLVPPIPGAGSLAFGVAARW